VSAKQEVFELLLETVKNLVHKFRYIDSAVDNLCKRLTKSAILNADFNEILKLYNTTGAMFNKSLELLDSIVCRFPQELAPDELELLEAYRRLNLIEKHTYKSKVVEEVSNVL
jgi:hypothetical protein